MPIWQDREGLWEGDIPLSRESSRVARRSRRSSAVACRAWTAGWAGGGGRAWATETRRRYCRLGRWTLFSLLVHVFRGVVSGGPAAAFLCALAFSLLSPSFVVGPRSRRRGGTGCARAGHGLYVAGWDRYGLATGYVGWTLVVGGEVVSSTAEGSVPWVLWWWWWTEMR